MKDVKRLGPVVEAVLQSLGLGELADRFAAEDIDDTLFWSLREDDLRELGLNLGQRKRLLERLRAGRPPSQETATNASTLELRRLTVLFSDLVGFTDLSTRIDPDDLHGILQDYYGAARRVAGQFEGFIASLQGDGIIMLFGYPSGRGRNADRAVGAALALQSELSFVAEQHAAGGSIFVLARVGIASGTAVVGYPAGASADEGLHMVGPVVNRAARLQTLAAPGTVVVDQPTRALAAAAFEFARLPDATLKGFDGAVGVSQAIRATGAAHPDAETVLPDAIFGANRPESETLIAAWQTACVDHPVLVRLFGEAGIGKSTLLKEIAAKAARDGARVTWLACSAVAAHTPLRPVIDLLETRLGPPSEAAAEGRLEKLRLLLADRNEDEIAAIAAFLGITRSPRAPTISSAEGRRRLLDALARHLLGNGDLPNLLLIEDLHWADATTRDLIQRCAELAGAHEVMIVASSREVEDALWKGDERCQSIPVTPLGYEAAREVLTRHLGGRVLPESVVETVIARSDGNPLMLEALARSIESLSDADLVQDLQVPTSIYESISGRLDGLRHGRQVVALLSVFEEAVEAYMLAKALGVAAQDLDAAVNELVDAGIAERLGTGPTESLRFRHSLYREVSYERLVKSTRIRLHRDVYQALMHSNPELESVRPGLLAWHAAHAGDHAIAAPLALSAGEQALQNSALIEASHFLRQALASLDQLPAARDTDRLRLRVLIAEASVARARHGIAVDAVNELSQKALSLAQALGDNRSELIALSGLYAHALVRAEYPAAAIWAARLNEVATLTQDGTFRMIGERALGAVALHTGAFDEAETRLRRALESYDTEKHLPLAHAQGYDHAELSAVFLSFTLWLKGDPVGAARIGDFSISHSRQIEHAHSLAQALLFRSMLATLARDHVTALSCGQEAIDVGARHGLTAMHGASFFFVEAARLMSQAQPPAPNDLETLRARHETLLKVNPYNYRPVTGAILADLLLRGDRPDLACEALRGAEETQERTGETWCKPELMRVRAGLDMAEGDRAASIRTLRNALQAAEDAKSNSLALRIASDLVTADPSPGSMDRLAAARRRMISMDDGWDAARCQSLLKRAAPA